MTDELPVSAEEERLKVNAKKQVPLELWGPYLSEREWGTVREDYSIDGDAWNFFPFDHASARVYRWGEDGLAGLSDMHQNLCFVPAFWNHRDPIIKERLFGLVNGEGNHGEDVKELYYYLENTPTHFYMQYRYKYPADLFPYDLLRSKNRERSRLDPEFELLDTGLFNEGRYFDILITYAKLSSTDICISIEVTNMSQSAEDLTIIPTLWFKNRWSNNETTEKPVISRKKANGIDYAETTSDRLGTYFFYFLPATDSFMTENETNQLKIHGRPNPDVFVKDAIADAILYNDTELVRSLREKDKGTKFSPVYRLRVSAGEKVTIPLRLCNNPVSQPFGEEFQNVFERRKKDADDFFCRFHPPDCSDEKRVIQRQALAGLLWNKQFYHFDIEQWLAGDAMNPKPPIQRFYGRNAGWQHLKIADVLMMPDKWEYPWFAAWDLCFQCIPMAMMDPVFAKNQILLLCREWYMSPSGHIPAYEWDFNDVNPPIHAWAALQVFRMEREQHGFADCSFLKRIFQKLMLNFTWWANREDEREKNVFSGGFLGMDNIGVIDRNRLPPGTYLEQADATAWMGMYALNMMDMAMEIAQQDSSYEDMVTKFYEHFTLIAASLNDLLWDEEDHFFYDLLHTGNGETTRLKVRSLVGLSVLFNVGVIRKSAVDRLPDFRKRTAFFRDYRIAHHKFVPFEQIDQHGDVLISMVDKDRLLRLIGLLLDEKEFLSPHGIRSLSKFHEQFPFSLHYDSTVYSITYCPGDSDNSIFGGNSNWRGPVWMPLNYLIIQTLKQLYSFFGDELLFEFPSGSGNKMHLKAVADAISDRLISVFVKKPDGTRVMQGRSASFYQRPENQQLLQFHEFFHGETGEGLGAAHQTGWTSLVAVLIQDLPLYT